MNNNNFDLTIIETFIEDKKFKGFMVQSSNGDTQYMDIKEYKTYLQNRNKKSLVRFADLIAYDELNIDLEEFTISNEFKDEYFGWYHGTPIAIKK
jgi:hypothetical protein